MSKIKMDSRKIPIEKIIKKLKEKTFKLEKLDFSITNSSRSDVITDEGWPSEPLINNCWQQAIKTNSDILRLRFNRVGKCLDWNLEIMWYSSTRFLGWRRITKRIADWLISL